MFSVIVPVFNVEKYIRQCIDSILGQSFKDFEIILVDDGSTDGSGKICDDYSDKNSNISVIHKDNQGLISARREGFRHASGEYIVNCDSDDYLEQNALERLNEVFEKFDTDMILYNSFSVYEDHKDIFAEHIFEEGFISKESVYDKLLLTFKVSSLCMKSFKRSIVDFDRDYSDFYKLDYGEDFLQTIPLVVDAQKIYYLDEQLYNYRRYSGMMSKYINKRYPAYRSVCLKVKELLADEDFDELEYKTAKYIVQAAYDTVHMSLDIGEYHENDVRDIAADKEFIESYKRIKGTGYFGLFTVKQKIILSAMYYRLFCVLRWIFAGAINSEKRKKTNSVCGSND